MPLSALFGTSVAEDSAHGTAGWSNVSNALLSVGSYASTGLGIAVTYYLKWYFSFHIPPGATIDGIAFRIFKKKNAADPVVDSRVRLVKAGTVQAAEDKADTVTDWDTSDMDVTYGGAADLWSNTWTVDDINHAQFGVVFSADIQGMSVSALVDYCTMTVYYTGGLDWPLVKYHIMPRKRRKPRPPKRKRKYLHVPEYVPLILQPPLVGPRRPRPIFHK